MAQGVGRQAFDAARSQKAEAVARALAEQEQNRLRRGAYDGLTGAGLPATSARTLTGVLDYVPVVGDVAGAEDAYQAAQAGDWTGAGVAGAATLLGILPGMGDAIARGVRSIAPDPSYLYHVTSREAAEEIAKSGMRRFDPWHGADQEAWPDGSVTPRIYAGETPKDVEPFSPEGSEAVFLRLPREKFRRERGTPDWYSESDIPAELIEAIDSRGVPVPIGDTLRNENIADLPLFAAVNGGGLARLGRLYGASPAQEQ